MNISIISSEERVLLSQIEGSNDGEVSLWRISNVAIPIFTIFLSLICFAVFKNNEQSSLIIYLNLILNGAIPMIALNRIGAMGIYLLKFDKSKEKQLGLMDTYYLRTKLLLWSLVIIVISMMLYIYQVINHPFASSWWLLLLILLSIASVILSLKVSKNVYLLQEKFIDNTFDKVIMQEIQEKGHGENW